MKKLISLPLFIFISHFVFGQSDSLQDNRPTIKFDLNYLSNNVYLGRKDSTKVSYITPGIVYVSPSGFFAGANASFLTKEKRVDLFTLEAGYDWTKNNLDLSLSASKDFYNSQSVNVKSDLSAGISVFGSYSLSFIKPMISADLSLGSNKPDYTASFGIEHSFITSDEAFSFTPSFFINASTQNYYDGYYQNRRYGKGRKAKAATITAQALDASKFKIMDYELMGDATYRAKNFSFYFEPAYALPVNPNTITTTVKPPVGQPTTKTSVEKLDNSFYFTLGLSYRFHFGKQS